MRPTKYPRPSAPAIIVSGRSSASCRTQSLVRSIHASACDRSSAACVFSSSGRSMNRDSALDNPQLFVKSPARPDQLPVRALLEEVISDTILLGKRQVRLAQIEAVEQIRREKRTAGWLGVGGLLLTLCASLLC